MIDFKPAPDPATAVVLQRIAESDLPPYESMTPQEARHFYRENSKAVDLPHVEVGAVEDRAFETDAATIPVRFYRPTAAPAEGPLPVLLYYHGGGYVIGDLDTHDPICRALCEASGAAVIAVDYRLAPEHPYPAAVEDALAAFDWLLSEADDLGVSRAHIAVAGDSAGAALAAVVAQSARDRGIALRAQILFYPAVDMTMAYPSYAEFAETPPITKDVLQWFWDHYLGPNPSPETLTSPHASPIHAETLAGTAPAFVVTAGLDPLRDEGEAYARRLSQEGVETVYQCALGTIHGYLRLGRIVPAAQDTISAAAAFLKRRITDMA